MSAQYLYTWTSISIPNTDTHTVHISYTPPMQSKACINLVVRASFFYPINYHRRVTTQMQYSPPVQAHNRQSLRRRSSLRGARSTSTPGKRSEPRSQSPTLIYIIYPCRKQKCLDADWVVDVSQMLIIPADEIGSANSKAHSHCWSVLIGNIWTDATAKQHPLQRDRYMPMARTW